MPDPDWGRHCGDSWRAHVLATTGVDICQVVGASPRRPAEWVAMMRQLGVRSIGGVVTAVHGPSLPNPRHARRGDIVRKGWALGICRGELAEFFGADMVPIREVDQVWSLSPVVR